MRRTALTLCAILTLAMATSPAGVIAQKKEPGAGKADAARLPALIWRDPGDMASLDLMEQITRHIPRADAKWLGQRLSMLTDDQIRAAFRAAGYGAGDVENLTRTIRQRIAALEAL